MTNPQPGSPDPGALMGAAMSMRDNSGHGAIGYSPSTRRAYMSWQHRTRADAENAVRGQLPADAHIWWGHHRFVALAESPSRYGFGHGLTDADAMGEAIKAAQDPTARITALIHTNRGQLNPGP